MANHTREVRVELRLTPEEVSKLDQCAAVAKRDRSKLIRHLIDHAYTQLMQAQRATGAEASASH